MFFLNISWALNYVTITTIPQPPFFSVPYRPKQPPASLNLRLPNTNSASYAIPSVIRVILKKESLFTSLFFRLKTRNGSRPCLGLQQNEVKKTAGQQSVVLPWIHNRWLVFTIPHQGRCVWWSYRLVRQVIGIRESGQPSDFTGSQVAIIDLDLVDCTR